MSSIYRHSPDRIFIWIVIVLVIDLFVSGGITWSRWAVLGLVIFYFMHFFGDTGKEIKAITLEKERYAKGELSEEEFLRSKEQIRDEYTERFRPGIRYLIGIFLIVVGCIYILRNIFYIYFPIPWLPILLIALGLFAIFRRIK